MKNILITILLTLAICSCRSVRYVPVEKYRYLYRDRLVHDTLYVTRTDSVQVPYPVERQLTRWQQFKMRVGGWAVGLVALSALCLAFWMLWRKRG